MEILWNGLFKGILLFFMVVDKNLISVHL